MFTPNNPFFPKNADMPVFPVKPIPERDFGNGVLVRAPNWLGDAVMTFPALRQLKKMLPENCGLMILTPASLAPLYKMLDCADCVLTLENAHAFPTRQERKDIRFSYPGAGFLFNNSFRDALALKWAHVPRLHGTPARFRKPLMYRTFEFPERRDRVLNEPHQALKYLAMVHAAGAPEWDGLMPALTPDAQKSVPEKIRRLCKTPKPLLLLAPGAAYGSAKRWDPKNFRAVAQWWAEEGGLSLALGADKERAACAEAVEGLPEETALSLAGETSLYDLVRLFRHAELCLGNDSGLMHLAAAAGLPGVALFASTDPAATAPLSPDWIILYEKQECAPCFRRDCPDGSRRCFDPLTPEKAIGALKRLRAEKRKNI